MDASSLPREDARPFERRQSPRLQILEDLHGRVVPLGLEMTMRDISLGGFSVESPVAFPVGAVHRFRFNLDDSRLVTIVARVVHTAPVMTDRGQSYRTGLQFITSTEEFRQAVEALLDRMTGVVEFD